jgi:putative addiction module component (TIGR02574 family)
MADRARVLEDALTLPVADRASVAHELLRSLEPAGEDADVAAAWADEIGRRIDEVEAGTAELHDLDTVRARLEAASRA